ncbi:MAG: M23 family metallopeptidase [Oculatellaceae cyanobacterium bins.114]|nr:M23 family metallopeptidase [Oculatellaceae cyanobacterium bins.114]
MTSLISKIRVASPQLNRLLRQPRLILSLFFGLVVLLSVLTSPAQAFQVQVQPTDPQLGDTLSVIVQSDRAGATAPTVTFNQKTYPMFALGTNRYRALLPTTPLDRPGRFTIQVSDGQDISNLAVSLRDRSFPTQRIRVQGGGSDGTDFEFAQVNEFKQLVTPEKFWNGAFARPAGGDITTVYGVRRYYNGVFADNYYHRGVDYAGGTGAPVVAPAPGRVVLIGREAEGFRLHGNTIGLDHGQGVASIFIHLSRIDVREGDFVQTGQRIGAIGATGSATGPNLHWGLYVHGQSIDPVPWRYDGFE